tara:strand:- start:63 stop:392 length:330 start_codon:yes stop_codon:yes gene_type:complete
VGLDSLPGGEALLSLADDALGMLGWPLADDGLGMLGWPLEEDGLGMLGWPLEEDGLGILGALGDEALGDEALGGMGGGDDVLGDWQPLIKLRPMRVSNARRMLGSMNKI